MHDTVTIIVAYFSEIENIKRIIDKVSSQSDVIIVDNSEPSIFFDNPYLSSKVIQNNENLGVAKAFNQGILYASDNGYEYCLLLDDDSLPDNTLIQKLKTGFSISEGIYISCPRIIDKDQSLNSELIDYEKVKWTISSGSLIKLSLVSKINLYNEDLFIDYVDTEYCLRIRKLGFSIIKCNAALLYHRLGNIKVYSILGLKFVTTNHNHLRVYYKTRNRIIVWKRYFLFSPTFVLKQIFRLFYDFFLLLIFEERGIKKIKYMILGFIDGLKNRKGKYVKK